MIGYFVFVSVITVVYAASLYLAAQAFKDSSEFQRVLPSYIGPYISSLVVLFVALSRKERDRPPKLQFTANRNGQDLNLVVHVQNRSRRQMLVLQLSVRGFSPQLTGDKQDQLVNKEDDITYCLKRLAEGEHALQEGRPMIRQRRVSGELSYKFVGDARFLRKSFTFDDPFRPARGGVLAGIVKFPLRR